MASKIVSMILPVASGSTPREDNLCIALKMLSKAAFWMGELNVDLRVPKVIGKLIDGSELYQRFKDAAEHRFID